MLTAVFSAALLAHGIAVLAQPAMMPASSMTNMALTQGLHVSPFVSTSGAFGVSVARRF